MGWEVREQRTTERTSGQADNKNKNWSRTYVDWIGIQPRRWHRANLEVKIGHPAILNDDFPITKTWVTIFKGLDQWDDSARFASLHTPRDLTTMHSFQHLCSPKIDHLVALCDSGVWVVHNVHVNTQSTSMLMGATSGPSWERVAHLQQWLKNGLACMPARPAHIRRWVFESLTVYLNYLIRNSSHVWVEVTYMLSFLICI